MSVQPSELAAQLTQRSRADRAAEMQRAADLRKRLTVALCSLNLPGRLWLVGSLAWGCFGTHSDVDLVVEGASPEVATRLWDALSRLLAVPVDLLRLEELPPAFRERVLNEGELLHVT